MKRKTNLFYNQGVDANFVTFSNYGENLTGNFLTTNTKLFPSKFICLYFEDLYDSANFDTVKKNFINGLICYYENKMAFLRDKYEASERLDNIDSLGYLLRYIEKTYNGKYSISYVGNISELDYNGTYTDMICTILQNNLTAYEIAKDNSVNEEEDLIAWNTDSDGDSTALYGWSGTTMPTEYSDLKPIYDTATTYYHNCAYYLSINEGLQENTEDIKFNVIIPLYDYVDIDNGYSELSLEKLVSSYTRNVPYGVWITDKPITLPYSASMGRPSWSICLSTLFKVFPYGTKDPDRYNVEDDANHATYALILKRQTLIVDSINGLVKSLTAIQNQIRTLEGNILMLGGKGVDGTTLSEQLSTIKKDLKDLDGRVSTIETDYIVGTDDENNY